MPLALFKPSLRDEEKVCAMREELGKDRGFMLEPASEG